MSSPNQVPIFIKTPFSGKVVKLTSQIATKTGIPATQLITAGSSGALVESIRAYPLGANVATVLRLYYLASGSTEYLLIGEKTLASTIEAGEAAEQAASATEITLPSLLFPASNTDTSKKGLRLGPSDSLYIALGTAVAAGWVVSATGGDY